MNVAIPLITSIVSFVFVMAVLDQYLERRRPYQFVWVIGLALYLGASLMQFIREAFGISEAVFRTWYFTGAMLVPAYLGMGTIYLTANRRFADALMALLTIATIAAAALVYNFPLEQDLANLSAADALTGRDYIPVAARILAVFLNIAGTLAFVGGALYSAWGFWRRRVMGYRFAATVLIAVGGLTSAAGGALEGLGMPEPHAIALLLGVIIIYVGFVRSQEVFALFRLPFVHRTREAGQ